MNDEPPSISGQDKSWIERLISSFSNEPKSQAELLEIIREAASNQLLDQEAFGIIQGALGVSALQAREIMIPRSQMVTVNVTESPEEFLPKVIESGHSRFPVIGENSDDIKGILLAKDLLPLILKGHKDFTLESVIRNATIIPESKRLNVLLREFRENRYHMALVIDEYGGISGLITIEDILEEIVGEISDETDDDNDDVFIRKVADDDYIIKALTPIEDFNTYFKKNFSDEEFDTVGGLIMQNFGHLPKRNEITELNGFSFRVLYSDNRQIHLLRLTPPAEQ
ncbi:MAG: magnesium and cobalt transporter [Cellvibrionaceae bacterium]|jgi:magnesium and cobalt transporter